MLHFLVRLHRSSAGDFAYSVTFLRLSVCRLTSVSGFCPSNLKTKSGATSSSLGLRFLQVLTQVFSSILGLFPL